MMRGLCSKAPFAARVRAAMNAARGGFDGGARSSKARRAPITEDDVAPSRYPFGQRLRGVLPIAVAAVIFAALAAIGASHVTLKLRELEAGHALGELHRERVALQTEQRRLNVELGMLQSPERVLPLARERLGLLAPRPSQIGSVPP